MKPMFKRLISFTMIVAMLIALTACDSKKERLQDSDESHHYLYFKDSSKTIMRQRSFSTATAQRVKRSR